MRSPVNLKGRCCGKRRSSHQMEKEKVFQEGSLQGHESLYRLLSAELPPHVFQVGPRKLALFSSSDPRKAVAVGCLNSSTHRMAFVGGFWPLVGPLYVIMLSNRASSLHTRMDVKIYTSRQSQSTRWWRIVGVSW